MKCWSRLNNCLAAGTGMAFGRYGVVRYPESERLELSYSYTACAKRDDLTDNPEQRKEDLPAVDCMVFTHRGSVRLLPQTYRYIYGTWLTREGFEPAASFDFEYYGRLFLGVDDPESLVEIFVPVRQA
jgi:AraC family transcriptional regulator